MLEVRADGVYSGHQKWIAFLSAGNLLGRYHLSDLGFGESIMLALILNKQGTGVWNGFISALFSSISSGKCQNIKFNQTTALSFILFPIRHSWVMYTWINEKLKKTLLKRLPLLSLSSNPSIHSVLMLWECWCPNSFETGHVEDWKWNRVILLKWPLGK